eukprot:m.228447 g.228447  ORF g.228447 m.228447 type:complete len:441 (-) comp15190_c1_seq13:2340-3662(-)
MLRIVCVDWDLIAVFPRQWNVLKEQLRRALLLSALWGSSQSLQWQICLVDSSNPDRLIWKCGQLDVQKQAAILLQHIDNLQALKLSTPLEESLSQIVDTSTDALDTVVATIFCTPVTGRTIQTTHSKNFPVGCQVEVIILQGAGSDELFQPTDLDSECMVESMAIQASSIQLWAQLQRWCVSETKQNQQAALQLPTGQQLLCEIVEPLIDPSACFPSALGSSFEVIPSRKRSKQQPPRSLVPKAQAEDPKHSLDFDVDAFTATKLEDGHLFGMPCLIRATTLCSLDWSVLARARAEFAQFERHLRRQQCAAMVSRKVNGVTSHFVIAPSGNDVPGVWIKAVATKDLVFDTSVFSDTTWDVDEGETSAQLDKALSMVTKLSGCNPLTLSSHALDVLSKDLETAATASHSVAASGSAPKASKPKAKRKQAGAKRSGTLSFKS